MKWDHSYEDLSPKYWWMLAHKVDCEHSSSYSDLLLAAWTLERPAEARDPLLPKTTTARGSNITHFLRPGNLFPFQKLKGSHTLTTWSATVESNEAEEDSGTKPEGEEKAKSSAGEDAETSSGVGGADQSVGYIVHFANVVELYQRKSRNCFRCGSPDHLMKDCLEDLSKTAQKVSLNAKEGIMKKGGWAPQKPVVTQPASLDKAPWAWGCLKKFLSWAPICKLIGVYLRA